MHMYLPSSTCRASMASVNLRKWNKVAKTAGHHQSNYQICLPENLVKNVTLLALSSPEKQYLWLAFCNFCRRQYKNGINIRHQLHYLLIPGLCPLLQQGKSHHLSTVKMKISKGLQIHWKQRKNILFQQYMYSVF